MCVGCCTVEWGEPSPKSQSQVIVAGDGGREVSVKVVAVPRQGVVAVKLAVGNAFTVTDWLMVLVQLFTFVMVSDTV